MSVNCYIASELWIVLWSTLGTLSPEPLFIRFTIDISAIERAVYRKMYAYSHKYLKSIKIILKIVIIILKIILIILKVIIIIKPVFAIYTVKLIVDLTIIYFAPILFIILIFLRNLLVEFI